MDRATSDDRLLRRRGLLLAIGGSGLAALTGLCFASAARADDDDDDHARRGRRRRGAGRRTRRGGDHDED